MDPFKRAFIHEFKEDLDFTVVIEHIVTSNDVRVVDVTENLDLTAHLKANGVLVVTVDHFESVESSGRAM